MTPEAPNPTPNILVITPHPDDAESGAGGSIFRWTSAGSRVALVVCTNGDKGTSDHTTTPAELAALREEEQLKSAEILGIERVSFLRFPDQGLEDTHEFREKLVREIRMHRPEIVLTMDPNRPYLSHRDHRMTGRVTLDAIFPYARDPHAYPEHQAQGLEPHKVQEVYLWGADEPDTFLDVTGAFDKKMEALFCHKSQVGDGSDGTRRTRWMERYREAGKRAGVELAESFKRIAIPY